MEHSNFKKYMNDLGYIQALIEENELLRGEIRVAREAAEITANLVVKQFEETGDIDFGYDVLGIARYRANFFKQKYGVAAVFRQIPEEIMTAKQLGLPEVITKLASLPRGLVLVTGPSMWQIVRERTISLPSKILSNLSIKVRDVSSITVKSASTPKHSPQH